MKEYRLVLGVGGVFGLGSPVTEAGTLYTAYRCGAGPLIAERGRVLFPCEPDGHRAFYRTLQDDTLVVVRGEKDGNTIRGAQLLAAGAAPQPDEADFLQKQQQPAGFDDPLLGHFERNRRFELFEGRWLEGETPVRLSLDSHDNLPTVHTLLDGSAGWLRRAKQFAAEQLLTLANDWCEDAWLNDHEDEDESNIPPFVPLTAEDFAARLTLTDIAVDSDNNFDLWYSDGGMFWGHAVCVRGSLNGGFAGAKMEG